MRIEMHQGEQELYREMLGGAITPACAQLHSRIRKRLLTIGHNYPLTKESLAIIAELSAAVTNYNAEKEEPQAREERVENGHKDVTPIDEMSQEELEQAAAENQSFDRDAAGGNYKGNRIKWETVFKSTPNTPVSKLEKGRPISFIDPKDNVRKFGKFVKVSPRDKRMANVLANGKKVPFAVPFKNIEIPDLSPPSTEPLAVQI